MLDQAYNKLSDSSNKMFVAVAGNIGCGKTTLTKKISDRLGWKPAFESVTDNPYLDDFYKDMSKHSFALQIYFLNHRFKDHRNIQNSNSSSIQDRTIYEDAHIFARGLFEQGKMSKRDYENYLTLYSTIIEYLTPPTLMIFLRRSVDRLMDRIRERGRDCEKNISVDYISRLNDYYNEWYAGYSLGKYIVVDTDELDFLLNEKDFDRLVGKIHDSVEQKDMFLSLN